MKENEDQLLEINGDMDVSANGLRCDITLTASGAMTPQHILDAVSDMLMNYFSMSEEDWKAAGEGTDGLDS